MNRKKGRHATEFPLNYVVIDLETTGLDPTTDSIIEIAGVRVFNGTVVDVFETLVNPLQELDPFITELTGIKTEDLINAPLIKEALQGFCEFVGDSIVIGHNIHFDLNFIYDNCMEYLAHVFDNSYVDTLRISRKYIPSLSDHKLSTLVNHLNISTTGAHRALDDCYTTHALYEKLVTFANAEKSNVENQETLLLNALSFDKSNPLHGKKICVKGRPQAFSLEFIKAVTEKCGAKFSEIFIRSCDYIIFSKYTYKIYESGSDGSKFEKARELEDAGTLTILSEEMWSNMLGIPFPEVPEKKKSRSHPGLRAQDVTTKNTVFDESHPLFGKTCVFTGTLERMLRKDAMQMVVDVGGINANGVTAKTNYLILGNNDYCSKIKDGKSSKQKKAESLKLQGMDIEIISENVFYDMFE